MNNNERSHNLHILDTIKGIKTSAELVDKEGKIVSLPDLCRELITYIQEEATKNQEGTDSVLMDQILTLLCHVMHITLPEIAGKEYVESLLSTQHGRFTVAMAMLASLLLHQAMLDDNLSIKLIDKKITDEEKLYHEEINTLQEAVMIGLSAGIHPTEVVSQLVQSGQITSPELLDMINEDQLKFVEEDEDE